MDEIRENTERRNKSRRKKHGRIHYDTGHHWEDEAKPEASFLPDYRRSEDYRHAFTPTKEGDLRRNQNWSNRPSTRRDTAQDFLPEGDYFDPWERDKQRGGYCGESEDYDTYMHYEERRQHARVPIRGPKGYKRSDERIREDVCELLTYDSGIDVGDVEVSVSEGVVTLSGIVNSRAEKRLLEDLIERVRGITDVQNLLRINTAR